MRLKSQKKRYKKKPFIKLRWVILGALTIYTVISITSKFSLIEKASHFYQSIDTQNEQTTVYFQTQQPPIPGQISNNQHAHYWVKTRIYNTSEDKTAFLEKVPHVIKVNLEDSQMRPQYFYKFGPFKQLLETRKITQLLTAQKIEHQISIEKEMQ